MSVPSTVRLALVKGVGERGSPEIVARGLFVAGGTNPLICDCTEARRAAIQFFMSATTLVSPVLGG